MTSRTLVIVVLPGNFKILESDVAGKLAHDYLLEGLQECDGADIRIFVGDNTLYPAWCEKYPRFSKSSFADCPTEDRSDGGILIIDARAWLTCSALRNIFLRIRETLNCFRIVDTSAHILAAGRESATLAVYLSPMTWRSEQINLAYANSGQGLEQILSSGALAKTTVVESSQLGASKPPLLINSYVDIAEIERRLLLDRAIVALRQGVRIRDPNRVYIRGELVCGSDVEIDINVIIEGHVVLSNGVAIGANSIVKSSQIGERTRINPFSLVEHSCIGSDSFIGPYGRIRPGSTIGDAVQIGNYVEIKNSQVGAGSRINHHTFIGDSVLAEQVTIGAGTITCNHDGFGINKTFIERGAYIGSGCNLVAPVRIGAGATVGAGSTITRDVPAAELTLARAPQTTIKNWRGAQAGREKP